ncbi:hypothetical protein [Castellaniella caeni]
MARARDLHRQGVDVLIGIVETHGRGETQAMADGLPQLARKKVEYQGRTLEEIGPRWPLGAQARHSPRRRAGASQCARQSP